MDAENMSGPREIALNRRTDLLKLLAIVTMTIDHIGAIFFPYVKMWRIVGRLAFPIFCYCLAVGCEYTRSPKRYAARLGIMALVSQPLYVLALNHVSSAMKDLTFENPVIDAVRWYVMSFSTCNIMVALFIGALLIWTLKHKKWLLSALVAILVLFLDRTGWLDSSYGLKGILLMLAFWLTLDKKSVLPVAVGAYMIWWGLQYRGYSLFGINFGIQTFAVLALIFICLPLKGKRIRIPKWLFYAYYPLHLAVMYAVTFLIK